MNNGEYRPALPGHEYPPDLANYPDYGEGWMNEECVRINMQHQLIPKAPLRSALKRPPAYSHSCVFGPSGSMDQMSLTTVILHETS
jgi:hypothetical protein